MDAAYFPTQLPKIKLIRHIHTQIKAPHLFCWAKNLLLFLYIYSLLSPDYIAKVQKSSSVHDTFIYNIGKVHTQPGGFYKI